METNLNALFEMKILPMFLEFKIDSVGREVTNYKEFLYDLKRLAIAEKDKLTKLVSELANRRPEHSDDIYEHYADQYNMYDSKYVEFANNGIFVNTYSFFEFQLKDLSQMLVNFVTNKKGVYKKNGHLSLAENLRNNIYKISGLDFSSLDTIWLQIDNYRRIRNTIVHNGSNLIENENIELAAQTNYPLVSSKPQIKINPDNGDFYIIDEQFVIDFIELTEKYLLQLIKILLQLDKNDVK